MVRLNEITIKGLPLGVAQASRGLNCSIAVFLCVHNHKYVLAIHP